jgi:hypothetical protein
LTLKPASSVFDSKLAAQLTDHFADDDALALDCASRRLNYLVQVWLPASLVNALH